MKNFNLNWVIFKNNIYKKKPKYFRKEPKYFRKEPEYFRKSLNMMGSNLDETIVEAQRMSDGILPTLLILSVERK